MTGQCPKCGHETAAPTDRWTTRVVCDACRLKVFPDEFTARPALSPAAQRVWDQMCAVPELGKIAHHERDFWVCDRIYLERGDLIFAWAIYHLGTHLIARHERDLGVTVRLIEHNFGPQTWYWSDGANILYVTKEIVAQKLEELP